MLDRNYTSLVTERLPDGTTRQYTRFWTPEEIAERQAEEAAWLQSELEREAQKVRELQYELARVKRENLHVVNANPDLAGIAAKREQEIEHQIIAATAAITERTLRLEARSGV